MRPGPRIRSNMVAAGMIASVFCLGMIPVKADAVVSEDDFLVRTTGDLADLCKVTTSDPLYTAAINFCHGFSVGVYRVLEEQNRATSRHMFCIPIPALQRAAAITNFVQWVDANPDQKQQAPADGIATYLLRQFPCAAGK